MRVTLTAEAEADLDNILRYVAADSVREASKLIERLLEACDGLSDGAFRYAMVPGYEDAGVRRRVVGSYNVFYWVVDDTVEVLHVVHGARNIEAVLRGDD